MRVFSFAQESTRYCNYSKDKFSNELTFIQPCWITDADIEHYKKALKSDTPWTHNTKAGIFMFMGSLEEVEDIYMALIEEEGRKPQEARAILPNALKTELIMTGFISDWKHFFNLRAVGTTGAPHPQAKELAEPLMQEFINRGYIK